MKVSPLALLGITALLHSLACTSSAVPSDPTSYEALHRAARMEWGTTCVKYESSSYGTSAHSTQTDLCLQDSDCNDKRIEDDGDYFGGAAYSSHTVYSRAIYFEGTCDNQRPISCDARTAHDDCETCQYQSCCTPVALCDDDPNCIAVSECLTNCKDDKSCAQRCVDHGDSTAVEHLRKALECVQSTCKDRC